MIYFIFGTDYKKIHEKVESLIAASRKRQPDTAIVRLNAESFGQGVFEEYIGARGLFGGKTVVVLDGIFATHKEYVDTFIKNAQNAHDSENLFVLVESLLEKKLEELIGQYADKIYHFERKKVGTEGFFNIFTLADALGERKRKELWVRYSVARAAGVSPEEIHGTLFWAFKNAILAEKSGSAGESGLKPFVYSKSKAYGKKYSAGDKQAILWNLVSIYHDSRRGASSLDSGMEAFILDL